MTERCPTGSWPGWAIVAAEAGVYEDWWECGEVANSLATLGHNLAIGGALTAAWADGYQSCEAEIPFDLWDTRKLVRR